MATFTQIDRAKAWLDKTGLKQTNQPLYQIILVLIDTLRQAQNEITATAGSGGGTGSGITALSGDVVATGPGPAVATIQPNVVTYAKIQQTADSDVLIGRADTPGNVEEIGLGDNLIIEDGLLQIETPDGTLGLAHNLLSETHSDTIPFTPPDPGSIVVALEVVETTGLYYDGVIMNNLVNDLPLGIYAGYMTGFDSTIIAPIGGGYSVPACELVTPTLTNTWLSWEVINAFLQTLIATEEIGIFGFYNGLVPGQNEPPDPGTYAGYSPIGLALTATPIPDVDSEIIGKWSFLRKGDAGQYLRMIGGTPQWFDEAVTTAIASVGTVNNLDFQGANVVYLDNASLLTITGIYKGPVAPYGVEGNISPAYDGEKVTFISRGAGNVYFAHQNSGSTVGNRLTNWITSGITPLAAGYGRATYTYDATNSVWLLTEHQQGGMITVPFDAGLFTAATGAWTVAAGDVPEDVAYFINGKTIRLQMRAITTSTSMATASLFYTIPNSWTAGRRTNTIGFGVVATIVESLVTFVSATGATVITFNRMNGAGNFPIETNTLAAICNIEFDIN